MSKTLNLMLFINEKVVQKLCGEYSTKKKFPWNWFLGFFFAGIFFFIFQPANKELSRGEKNISNLRTLIYFLCKQTVVILNSINKNSIKKKNFSTNQNKNHLIQSVHGEAKNFKCNVCNRIFSTKQKLSEHVENNQEKRHNCKFCGIRFGSNKSMRTNKKDIHEKQRKTNVILVESTSLKKEI